MSAQPAVIYERGNGWPGVGDYLLDEEGTPYRVVSLDGSIETGNPGDSNWIRATVEKADWDACAEDDEFPASLCLDVERP